MHLDWMSQLVKGKHGYFLSFPYIIVFFFHSYFVIIVILLFRVIIAKCVMYRCLINLFNMQISMELVFQETNSKDG